MILLTIHVFGLRVAVTYAWACKCSCKLHETGRISGWSDEKFLCFIQLIDFLLGFQWRPSYLLKLKVPSLLETTVCRCGCYWFSANLELHYYMLQNCFFSFLLLICCCSCFISLFLAFLSGVYPGLCYECVHACIEYAHTCRHGFLQTVYKIWQLREAQYTNPAITCRLWERDKKWVGWGEPVTSYHYIHYLMSHKFNINLIYIHMHTTCTHPYMHACVREGTCMHVWGKEAQREREIMLISFVL